MESISLLNGPLLGIRAVTRRSACTVSPRERDRQRERGRWSEEERAGHNDGESGKKGNTRYRQRHITLNLTATVKSDILRCCKSGPVLLLFVREIITFWIERAPRHSEAELKSSAKFLAVGIWIPVFGDICFIYEPGLDPRTALFS